jgi:putative sigma-54 modulation protein
MDLTIKGKNVEVTDRLRNYVEKKIGKLDRYLPSISEAWVELSSEAAKAAQDRQVCQVTVRSNGTILRAEERSDDMFTSIDTVLDKMYRQIARYKGKRKNRWRGTSSIMPEALPLEFDEEEVEEEPAAIVRVKRFPITPMHTEEAVEQMELLGHDFFVFFNANEGEINVLYRRKDGDYGVIQPVLA